MVRNNYQETITIRKNNSIISGIIVDNDIYRQYLNKSIQNDNMTYEKKLEIFEEMFIWSKDLGIINKIDPLEGTEKTLELPES